MRRTRRTERGRAAEARLVSLLRPWLCCDWVRPRSRWRSGRWRRARRCGAGGPAGGGRERQVWHGGLGMPHRLFRRGADNLEFISSSHHTVCLAEHGLHATATTGPLPHVRQAQGMPYCTVHVDAAVHDSFPCGPARPRPRLMRHTLTLVAAADALRHLALGSPNMNSDRRSNSTAAPPPASGPSRPRLCARVLPAALLPSPAEPLAALPSTCPAGAACTCTMMLLRSGSAPDDMAANGCQGISRWCCWC